MSEGFTKPDTTSAEYQRLWKHLNEEQRECLVKHNRIPVYVGKTRLFVIPYSRFHNRDWSGDERHSFYHVSVQVFHKNSSDVYKYQYLRCGGILNGGAAENVLGIKLLLDASSRLYTERSEMLNSGYDGELEWNMTLEETYEIAVDGVYELGEKCEE